MSEELKSSFYACASLLKSKIDSFKKASIAIPKNKRTLENRYKAILKEEELFSTAYKQLIQSNISFAEETNDIYIRYSEFKLSLENVETEYDQFLESLEESIRQNEILVQSKLEEKSRLDKLKLAIRKFDIFLTKFDSLIKTVCNYIKTTEPSVVSLRITNDYKAEVDSCYNELCTYFDEYSILQLSDEDYHVQEKQYQQCVIGYNHVKEMFTAHIIACEQCVTKISSENTLPSSSFKSVSKINKLEPPVFDNLRRSYARFKNDFHKIVAMHTDESYQAIYLRTQCTHGRAKSIIQNLDNVNDMWKLLDLEYGQPEQLIQDVTDRIRKLNFVIDHDTSGIINFADTILNAFNDLKLISVENSMFNPMTLREIESKMPDQMALDWSTLVNSNTHITYENKMPALITFLENERSKASYRMNVMGRVRPKREPLPNSRGHINYVSDERIDTKSPCIYCNSDHALTRRCNEFRKQSVSFKRLLLMDRKACFLCFEIGHQSDNCIFKTQNKWQPCKYCQNWHSHSVCTKSENGDVNTSENSMLNANTAKFSHNCEVMLPIQKVQLSNGQFAVCLWDTGATGAIVRTSFAENLGIKGHVVTYLLTMVDGTESKIVSKLYEIELIDLFGKIHVVQAVGMDRISSNVKFIKIGNLWKLFDVPSLQFQDVKRCNGAIDLLIGEKYTSLHPKQYQIVDNLVLRKSIFGSGWLISGTHPSLCHSDLPDQSDINICYGRVSDIQLISLLSTDNLGLEIPSKCKRCRNCLNCIQLLENLSFDEQQENLMIENGLKLNTDNCKWTSSYPFLKSPSTLVNNKWRCTEVFKSTEKRLLKNPDDCTAYDDQFSDMLDRGVLIELSEEYMRSWSGSVFYLPHFAVHKDTSESTPVRIVFNSASKDVNGLCLNDTLAKGQNALNNILGVMIRFRKYEYVAVGDISKMFHSIATTEIEWNLHRVLYRPIGSNNEFKTFAITCVSFGDRPAPAIAVTALRKTAQLFEDINEQVSKHLIEDSYMDDCLIGGNNLENLVENIRDAECILGKGGLYFKGWTKSGDFSERTVISFSGENRLLGLCWNAAQDCLYFKIRINFGVKKCGKRSESDLQWEELPDRIPKVLTKRKCLSVTNGIYDPLGLIQPVLLKLKLALRDIVLFSNNTDANLKWDDSLPSFMHDIWSTLIKELFEIESLRFPRCIFPATIDTKEKPILVTFSDGSSEALATVSYIRHKLLDGRFHVHLVMSKCKVTPMIKLTLPRIELLSAVMNARLSYSIENNLQCDLNRHIHIVDSSIVLSMIKTPSICYGEFVGCRIAEIQRKTNINDWFWTESINNIADLGTRRSATVKDLNSSSVWQCGPQWLQLEFGKWPISNSIESSNVCLPEMKKKYDHLRFNCEGMGDLINVLSTSIVNSESSDVTVNLRSNTVEFENNSPEVLFKVSKYSNFNKLLRVTAFVFKFISRMKDKSVECSTLNASDISNAELFWVKRISILSRMAFDNGKLKPLRPILKNDLIVISGRAAQHYNDYNPVEMPVLDPRHPVTKLYVKHVHEMRHSGIDQTVAIVRVKYWIPSCRKLSKFVKRHCYLCRIIEKLNCNQLMSPLPISRLKPGPIWYHTGLDLFGPLEIRDAVKKRVKGKCWGIIFVCHASKAVYLTITEGYSTDYFIQALQRFINRNGSPRYIYSDRGSQLVGAAREITEFYDQLNLAQIERFSASMGFDWKLSPSKAPWYNGLPERFIAILKKQLKIAVGFKGLTFGELETTLSHIEYLINSRPLFLYPDHDPLNRVGTPMDLLIGRSELKPPAGEFEFVTNLTKRCRFQLMIVDQFWKKWIQQTYQYLVPYAKWRREYRNITVGDIVYIFDKNSLKGQYQLGMVDSVKPDSDGLIRRAVVKYKNVSGCDINDIQKRFRYTERPIQNLVLIVPVEEMNSTDFHYGSESVSPIVTDNSIKHMKTNSNKSSKATNSKELNKLGNFSNCGRSIKAPNKLDL